MRIFSAVSLDRRSGKTKKVGSIHDQKQRKTKKCTKIKKSFTKIMSPFCIKDDVAVPQAVIVNRSLEKVNKFLKSLDEFESDPKTDCDTFWACECPICNKMRNKRPHHDKLLRWSRKPKNHSNFAENHNKDL